MVKRKFAYVSLAVTRHRGNSTEMLRNRIKEVRKQRRVSIEQLAELSGLSASYISRMSRGDRNVSLKNLEKLATALECSPEDLIVRGAPLDADIAAIWAAIPADRRELALSVLGSFANADIDNEEEQAQPKEGTRLKKRTTRNPK